MYIKEELQLQIDIKRVTEKWKYYVYLTIHSHPRQAIKIVLVYRNVACTVIDDDEVYGYPDNFFSAPYQTLIMGIFNLPHIIWTTRQSRARGSKLIDLINTNFLQQHVVEPTRQSNIHDLVMTTPGLRMIELEFTDKIGDHKMIDFALQVRDLNTKTSPTANGQTSN
ncbi:Endonuclease/exonuclease/phosphatase [Trinorchestia longiramus]|nr:Endonuclease/exonuclease/phosphatase [Trinorchestia longiramus]